MEVFMKTIVFAGQIYDVNVARLEMNGKNIRDLTPLRELTKIEYLALEENQITDITLLNLLTHLKTLFLCHNQIKDITAVHTLTRFEYAFCLG